MKFRRFLAAIAAAAIAAICAQAQTPAPPAATPSPPAAPAPASPPPNNALSPPDLAAEGFWGHLNDAFLQQLGTPAWSPPDPNAPPGQRRGFAAPFDSPPYPDGDWQIGGVPCEIGDPGETPDYPIMQALDEDPGFGKAVKDSRVKFYGWLDVSGNLSSSHNTGPSIYDNFPEAYDEVGNVALVDQLVVYLERIPNEFQTDHYDWGFRVSGIYGLDYRYTTMWGIASNQLLQRNQEYGYDFPMVYFNLYDPFILMGLNLTIGRMISEPDIEAQLAPNNLMSSHSLLYTYDPYTQIGVFPSLKINKNWTVQYGISFGNDVAPWEHGPYAAHPTSGVMVQWISDSQNDSVYAGDNVINNGHFGYNNLQMIVQTWTHKFNERFWSTTETWYMWQKDCPVAGSPLANELTADGFVVSGAFPTSAYASEWAALNYLQYRIAGNTFVSFRSEYFDDKDGQRTGFATPYIENSLGLTWWPNELLTIRPEVRYEHALNATPYDNGTCAHQRTVAIDMIMHF